jgi:DNA-directed RNA polymerase subunit E'/Rpb7
MEQLAVFQEKVAIQPIDLRPDITSFDDILLSKLKKQLEGKCSKHGYVIPDSLQLLSRSLGVAEKGRGTADFLYYLKAQGKVYNPPDGIVVEGEVSLKNKMGCYAILHNAVRIMIPRDLHIGNEEFDTLEVGDRIQIEIKKSQFRVNATHILSIGLFLGRIGGAAALAPAVAPALAPALAPVVPASEEGGGEEEEEGEEEDGEHAEGKGASEEEAEEEEE